MDTEPKNVVLITVDALRQDHLSYTSGQESVPTPNIDSFAEQSIVCTSAYANGPHTRASFPSILTGTYPWEYGGYDRIVSERPHIADSFRQHGYSTGGFHSNPYLGSEFGYARGFDTFRSGDEDASLMERCRKIVMEKFFGDQKDTLAFKLIERTHSLAEYVAGRGIGVPYIEGEDLNGLVQNWLENYDSNARFAWVHYMDVHDPYLPKDNTRSDDISSRRAIQLQKRMVETPESLSANDRKELKKLYKGEVEYVDRCICELLDAIDRSLGLDETVVCLVSDHGEAFGEHGYFRHPHEFHEEVSRIPILLRSPDRDPKRIDTPASNVDVLPTLLSCVGARIPGDCSGRNLLSERHDEGEYNVYGHTGDKSQGKAMVANRRWKYILNRESGSETLYDLRNDPGEENNLADERTEVRDKMNESLQIHLNEITDVSTDVSSPDVTRDVEDRLEQLGYK